MPLFSSIYVGEKQASMTQPSKSTSTDLDFLSSSKRPNEKEEEILKERGYKTNGTENVQGGIILQVKWGSEIVSLSITETDFETFSISDLKAKIECELNIPMDRQKLLGITTGKRAPQDPDLLSALTFKKPLTFVLVGTPADKALVEPADIANIGNVVNDLSWDYVPAVDAAASIRTETHLNRLKKAIEKTEIRMINKFRQGKKLLVLDLDYTLFDCKGVASNIEKLKRPFLDYFMQEAYINFDLVVWSQTHWKWVEMKCTELGFLTSPHFNLCFVLDRSSMFTVTSRQNDGNNRSHEVKALELIWEKFPEKWGPHNTLHIDDLGRNFAMNPKNGIKVSSYRIHKRHSDKDLLLLSTYLKTLINIEDLTTVDHFNWKKKTKYNQRNAI